MNIDQSSVYDPWKDDDCVRVKLTINSGAPGKGLYLENPWAASRPKQEWATGRSPTRDLAATPRDDLMSDVLESRNLPGKYSPPKPSSRRRLHRYDPSIRIPVESLLNKARAPTPESEDDEVVEEVSARPDTRVKDEEDMDVDMSDEVDELGHDTSEDGESSDFAPEDDKDAMKRPSFKVFRDKKDLREDSDHAMSEGLDDVAYETMETTVPPRSPARRNKHSPASRPSSENYLPRQVPIPFMWPPSHVIPRKHFRSIATDEDKDAEFPLTGSPDSLPTPARKRMPRNLIHVSESSFDSASMTRPTPPVHSPISKHPPIATLSYTPPSSREPSVSDDDDDTYKEPIQKARRQPRTRVLRLWTLPRKRLQFRKQGDNKSSISRGCLFIGPGGCDFEQKKHNWRSERDRTRHMRTHDGHLGVKRFSCIKCGEPFTRIDMAKAKTHVRTCKYQGTSCYDFIEVPACWEIGDSWPATLKPPPENDPLWANYLRLSGQLPDDDTTKFPPYNTRYWEKVNAAPYLTLLPPRPPSPPRQPPRPPQSSSGPSASRESQPPARGRVPGILGLDLLAEVASRSAPESLSPAMAGHNVVPRARQRK